MPWEEQVFGFVSRDTYATKLHLSSPRAYHYQAQGIVCRIEMVWQVRFLNPAEGLDFVNLCFIHDGVSRR